jgi:hypothetical protein
MWAQAINTSVVSHLRFMCLSPVGGFTEPRPLDGGGLDTLNGNTRASRKPT